MKFTHGLIEHGKKQVYADNPMRDGVNPGESYSMFCKTGMQKWKIFPHEHNLKINFFKNIVLAFLAIFSMPRLYQRSGA